MIAVVVTGLHCLYLLLVAELTEIPEWWLTNDSRWYLLIAGFGDVAWSGTDGSYATASFGAYRYLRPYGYPALIWVFNGHIGFLLMLNMVCAGLTALAVQRLTASRTTALVAGVFMLPWSPMLMADVIAACLFLWGLHYAGARRLWWLGGLLLAGAAYVREAHFYLALAAPIVAWLIRHGFPRIDASRIVRTYTIIIALLAPQVVYTYRQTGYIGMGTSTPFIGYCMSQSLDWRLDPAWQLRFMEGAPDDRIRVRGELDGVRHMLTEDLACVPGYFVRGLDFLMFRSHLPFQHQFDARPYALLWVDLQRPLTYLMMLGFLVCVSRLDRQVLTGWLIIFGLCLISTLTIISCESDRHFLPVAFVTASFLVSGCRAVWGVAARYWKYTEQEVSDDDHS